MMIRQARFKVAHSILRFDRRGLAKIRRYNRGNMQFPTPLIKGKLIKRYKRFLADVELPDGQVVTAHCPNTGAMTGCAEPGFSVWLSHSSNPKRKLAYTWELAQNAENHWIGINTHNANKLVCEGIESQAIAELKGYSSIKREVKYGEEGSRIDILLSCTERPNCYVEVKSVTLLQDNSGFFPDAKSIRGAKHLRELAHMKQQGHRAVLLFCVQHSGINQVRAAEHIDPVYAQTLALAQQNGVEILVYGCKFSEQKILINQPLAFI